MTGTRSPRQRVRVRASGKVNLALRVGGRRDDGYHALATVFQAVGLFDELEVVAAPPGEYSISVEGPQAHLVPTGEGNLAIQAARLLARSLGDESARGVAMSLRKSIPVTGGMAGGSADAAAALVACSALEGSRGFLPELTALGAALGADVPFCLLGGTALGHGRGDELVPLLTRGDYAWVLALPDVELSTPEVFGRFDELNPDAPVTPPPVPAELLAGLATGDVARVAAHVVNDLEPAALSLRPHLADVLDAGRAAGALAGIVSGSGPTCAFLAADDAEADRIAADLEGAALCRAVRRARGPVAGARIIG